MQQQTFLHAKEISMKINKCVLFLLKCGFFLEIIDDAFLTGTGFNKI